MGTVTPVQAGAVGLVAGVAVTAATAGASALGVAALRRRGRSSADDALLTAPLPAGRPLPVTSADGTRLHAVVTGREDAPTVVLVHGWTCRREFWAAPLHHLDADHRVVSYDLRGHGRSGSATPAPGQRRGDWSTAALSADLAAVLDAALRPGERAVVAGHSLGAMSVLALAAHQPERLPAQVAAVLLASTGADALLPESTVLPLPSRLAGPSEVVARAALVAPVPLGHPTRVSHALVRHAALSRRASDAQVAFCERIVLGSPPAGRAALGRTLADLDLRTGVAALDVPTAVLTGTADRLTPPGHAERLAASLPRLERFVSLAGVGHMTPVEAPRAVSAEIRRLVEAHLPGVGLPASGVA